MSTIPDSLGRVWSFTKLDALLGNLDVQRAVIAAEDVGLSDGRWNVRKVIAWAREQGRSEAGTALLLVLCWRSACLDGGAEP